MGFEENLKKYLILKGITSAKVKAIDIQESITLENFEEFLYLATANNSVVFYKLELTTIALFFMYNGLLTKYVSGIEKLESKLESKLDVKKTLRL